MKYNKKQKQIIKAINSGKVYDILSFVEHFKCYKVYNADKERIKRKFEAQEKGKTHTVLRAGKNKFFGGNILNGEIPQINVDDDIYEQKPAELGFENAKSYIKIGQEKYDYPLCSDNGVMIATSFEEIKAFLSIWEILKRELYVLEVPKSINKNELGLFFDVIDKNKEPKINNIDLSRYTPVEIPENWKQLSEKIAATETYIVDANQFIDEELNCNYDKLHICEHYLSKKILPTPTLNNYIHDKFNTPEQKLGKMSLATAFIAIVISVLTSIISMYITMSSDVKPVLQSIDDKISELSNNIAYIDNKEEAQINLSSDNISKIQEDLKGIKEIIETYLNR